VKAGELKFREGAPPRDNNDTALESGDIEDLESILDRGFARSEVDSQKIEDIRTDVRHLMRLVRNCLAESEWELCTLLTPSIRE
jgi:ATP-dependent exoDNAse (exonuclease V) alpha subunit